MAIWEKFGDDVLHKALSTSRNCFTEAMIMHNIPMASGYPRFRVNIRKTPLSHFKEGEQENKSLTIELSDDEVLLLAKFVLDFDAKYKQRFKKYQDDVDK